MWLSNACIPTYLLSLYFQKDDVTWERINKPHSTVSFEQSQSLEVLRWKLREAQANLESNINIGNTILEHANDITETLRQQSPAALCHHSRLVSELVQYVSDLQIHRRKALGLLDSTMSIESLVRLPTDSIYLSNNLVDPEAPRSS
jgi:hypothetical protein